MIGRISPNLSKVAHVITNRTTQVETPTEIDETKFENNNESGVEASLRKENARPNSKTALDEISQWTLVQHRAAVWMKIAPSRDA